MRTKKKLVDIAPRETISSVARRMILEGATNAMVLAALVEKFNVNPESRARYYPGWYRAELVRTGKISRKKAAATRH